jgi:hypothetical protein
MITEISKLGTQAALVMQSALETGVYVDSTQKDRQRCLGLNGRGLLSRDKVKATTWYPTEKARSLYPVATQKTEIVAPSVVEDAPTDIVGPRSDASGLTQTVERARALLDDGDVLAAKRLAGGAYLEAKAAAQYAATFGEDGKRLIAKARQLQGDALLIEARAKMQIAAAWDQADSEGRTLKGRPKSVPDENAFTAEEAGLSRKDIHEARKLAEAERIAPGLVERAIAARLESGLEPSRANLRAAVGTASAPKADRGDNFYQTPDVATRTLLAFESFTPTIWEPACGLGAISHVLEDRGYEVILSDLVDRGAADKDGELQATGDFLASRRDERGIGADIVTNPPYGEVLNDFVAHALREHRPRKMALLLNLNFLCGFADEARSFVMDENPPARVYIFKRRLPMMHREGWDGPKASSRMNTAWFVWERRDDGGYGDETLMRRVDWTDYVDADARSPGAGGHVVGAYFVEDFTRETPRKTLDERLDEERERSLTWLRGRTDFDRPELRRAIGMRESVAEALISEFIGAGIVGQADADGRYLVLISESEAA